MNYYLRLLFCSLWLLALGGCSSSSSDGSVQVGIGGSVNGLDGSGLVLQLNAADDLTVDADGSFTFSSKVTEGSSYEVSVASAPSGQSCSVSNGSGTAGSVDVTDVQVTCLPTTLLSGKVEYQDRQYASNGFTGLEPYKPVRHALIELLDAEGNLLQSTASDGNGNYQFAETAVGDYTLYIYAEAASDSGYQVAVKSQRGYLYAVSQAVTLTLDSTVANVRIDRASKMAGAYNIYDVYITATEFIADISNGDLSLPALNAFWTYKDSTGTYTCSALDNGSCSNGAGIYVLSDPVGSGDTDEFDDDVLWHEFAHFVEFSLGHFDSPGGYHTLSADYLDLRLSWSEGHGNYFQAALKKWLLDNNLLARLSTPSFVASSYYIDNVEYGEPLVIDLATAPTVNSVDGSPIYVYSTNETAVANLLWQFNQQPDLGAVAVWDVLSNSMTSNTTADTLESFWDGMLTLPQRTPSKEYQWQAILAGREVYYKRDSFEVDDTLADAVARDCSVAAGATYPLTCVDAEEHYLYQRPVDGLEQQDSDYIALNLSANVTYRIYSHNLRNGGDTVIGLYDASGNVLQELDPDTGLMVDLINDDAADCGSCQPSLHNGTHFSSELTYTPTVDETVYLQVVTTNYVYNNVSIYGYIGRYGTYSLSVEATAGP